MTHRGPFQPRPLCDAQRCEPVRSRVGTAVCAFVHTYVHRVTAPRGRAATRVYRAVQPDVAWPSTASGTQTFSAGVLAMSTRARLICRRTCSTEHPPRPGRPPSRRGAAAAARGGNSTRPCSTLETQRCPEPWASCIPLSALRLSQSPLVFSVLTRP